MRRAFQWDLARQVERLDVLLDLLPRYADWGYEQLYLHLEDAVDYPSLPGVARADAYRWRDFETLVQRAQKVGIGVVPIVNLLGHTQYLIKTERWRDLNERRDANGRPLPTGQLCPLHPETPEVIELLLRDTLPLCTAGLLHAGLDESFHLGQCPRCRAEVAEIGLGGHFARHVQRIHRVTQGAGVRLGIWADMLALFPEAIPLLPRGVVAYDWYYYPFRRRPRVELFNFRDYDLIPALQRQEIAWWACPMSGAFRHEPLPVFGDRLENIRSWLLRAHTDGAEGMLVTSWEAYRLALPSQTLVDAAAASLWLEKTPGDNQALLAQGLARVFGPGARTDRAASSLLTADMYPYSGYFEWEAGQRWDGGVTATPARELSRVIDHLAGLDKDLPPVLAASLRLRQYFAHRALFLREAADTVAALRQALRLPRPELRVAALLRQALHRSALLAEGLDGARQDAEVMWTSSRPADSTSQNRQLLGEDARRLGLWLQWLERVVQRPTAAAETSVVFARWRLQFEVHNFAPAVQRVSVEVRADDGSWLELAARHTIEFQAAAAAPTADLRRAFAVGLDSPDAAVRIVLRGTGQVRLRRFYWTDGVVAFSAREGDEFILGEAAPTHGLPDLPEVRATLPLSPRKPEPAGPRKKKAPARDAGAGQQIQTGA